MTIDEYLASLPEDRRAPMAALRAAVMERLPAGFEETISKGMLHYVVPHSTYPAGYHCNPADPLPFLSIASQKNAICLYHMGMYADLELTAWFTAEYPKHSKTKLDMGKSCVRFKKPDQIPLDLVRELASKVTPAQWIARYESIVKR